MFNRAEYGNDLERILAALEAGELTADDVLGVEQCLFCKQWRPAAELNICTECRTSYCDTCPPICQCTVERSLDGLR